MSKPLENLFSWSHSRAGLLEECERAYFFNYFGSWMGWDPASPERARDLYFLKKLDNRWGWAGHIVHGVISRELRAVRFGEFSHIDPAIEEAHKVMRQDFAWSSEARYLAGKKRRAEFLGLLEHFYSEHLPKGIWLETWETVERSIRGWFASDWPNVAAFLTSSDWLVADDLSFDESAFTYVGHGMDGVKVFAKPDFAYREGNGAVVVDWKTGKPSGEESSDQLVAYALFLSAKYAIPVDQIRGVLVYLAHGVEREVEITPAAVEGFRGRFAASVARMRRLLADVDQNVPRPEEDFARTEDRWRCLRCRFRKVCQPQSNPGGGSGSAIFASGHGLSVEP